MLFNRYISYDFLSDLKATRLWVKPVNEKSRQVAQGGGLRSLSMFAAIDNIPSRSQIAP